MRLLVLQHIDCEHPGRLRDFLHDDGVEWTAVELDEGEPIPPLEDYDAMWVMGGPMDVWDVDEHPWLVGEKRAIRRWVRELRRPFLGVCLGHQLLADALGGTCGPQRPPEIGVLPVELTPQGRADPIFEQMAERQHALQWHSVCVAQPPEDAVVLASSPVCRVQAMRVGPCAWSMQYHVEVEDDTVRNWGAIDAYRQALESTLGPGSIDARAISSTRSATPWPPTPTATWKASCPTPSSSTATSCPPPAGSQSRACPLRRDPSAVLTQRCILRYGEGLLCGMARVLTRLAAGGGSEDLACLFKASGTELGHSPPEGFTGHGVDGVEVGHAVGGHSVDGGGQFEFRGEASTGSCERGHYDGVDAIRYGVAGEHEHRPVASGGRREPDLTPMHQPSRTSPQREPSARPLLETTPQASAGVPRRQLHPAAPRAS